jgi:hypothetical protein
LAKEKDGAVTMKGRDVCLARVCERECGIEKERVTE